MTKSKKYLKVIKKVAFNYKLNSSGNNFNTESRLSISDGLGRSVVSTKALL